MFRMPRDADRWFRGIADKAPLKTKFDLYYLCLVAGLKEVRLSSSVEKADFYEAFPKEYESSRFEVLGLLISAEMHREGLDFSDSDSVQSVISRLISPDTPSRLSADGFDKMNQYAAGGFDVLGETFGERPQDTYFFLLRYASIFD